MSSRLLRSPALDPTRVARRIVVDSSLDAATAAAIDDRNVDVGFDGSETLEEVVVDSATITGSKVVASYEARAWADLVLRSLARDTNSLIASTRFLVVGTGPVAECLIDTLIRLGARVEMAADDPVELLTTARARAVTAHYIVSPQFVSPDVDVVITTGKHHPILDAGAIAEGGRPLLVVNAARPPHASAGAYQAGDVIGVIRNLSHLNGPRPTFAVPSVTDDELDRAAAWVRAAYAIHFAAAGGEYADAELAKALLR